MRPVTLFTGQWADLPLETLCEKAKNFGYDGLELACWGDHFEVDKADEQYCNEKLALLGKHGLKVYAISTHLVGQAVSDRIDERHKSIVPDYVWGDGNPEGVNKRAAEEVIKTGEAAARLGVPVVNGFNTISNSLKLKRSCSSFFLGDFISQATKSLREGTLTPT